MNEDYVLSKAEIGYAPSGVQKHFYIKRGL